jgi:predicted amidohydrolase
MKMSDSRKIKVAAVQPLMEAGEPEFNIAAALRLTKKALRSGAKLVVLPELFITGFDYDCIHRTPQRRTDECLSEMRGLARASSTVIIAGSVTRKKGGLIYNTTNVIGPSGRTVAAYSKMHLFSLMDEDVHLAPGTATKVAHTPLGKIAPNICFDIRFPEVARSCALMGAEVLAVPAEFPHPRIDHWRTLLRARAIENQFFVIASNRVGEDHTGHYFGHSAIIGPGGETLVEADETESVITATIDLSAVAAARAAIPCLDRINPALTH